MSLALFNFAFEKNSEQLQHTDQTNDPKASHGGGFEYRLTFVNACKEIHGDLHTFREQAALRQLPKTVQPKSKNKIITLKQIKELELSTVSSFNLTLHEPKLRLINFTVSCALNVSQCILEIVGYVHNLIFYFFLHLTLAFLFCSA